MTGKLRHLVVATCIGLVTTWGAALALAEVNTPSPDGAKQEQGQRGDRHGRHFFKKMVKELGLSEQQKSQAKALFEKNREQDRPLVQAQFQARRDLRNLIHSGSADEAAIRAQAGKLAAAQTELALRRAQGTREFLALLTPDQVAKLKELRAEREAKWQQKGKKGRRCAPEE